MDKILHRMVAILYALMAAMAATAQPNSGAESLQGEIGEFLKSDGIMTKTIHDGQGLYQHLFKITCGEDTKTDETGIPLALKRLETAFTDTRHLTSSSFFYDTEEKVSLIKGLNFEWPNSYKGSVSFRYGLENYLNYRISTYADGDGTRHCLALVWKPLIFTDKDGKPFRCIDGYVLELHGKHWNYFYINQSDDADGELYSSGSMGTADPDTLDFVQLREKIGTAGAMFDKARRANDKEQQDALAYVVYRISSEYGGRLSNEQYETVTGMIQKMYADTDNNSRKRLLLLALGNLAKLVRHESMTDSVRYSMTTSFYSFCNVLPVEEERWTRYEEYRWDGKTAGPRYVCRVSGESGGQESYMLLKSYPIDTNTYRMKAKDGRFDFRDRLHRGQFLKIFDGSSGNIWWLITDSVPVNINMGDGSLEGSGLNRRFIQYQKRIKRMTGEMRKYRLTLNGENEVLDMKGYSAIVDSIRLIMQEAIKDNPDNMIGAFFLAEDYTNMSYAQLSEALTEDKGYAKSVTMQPVWRHLEGLRKRLPGTRYTDIALQDTAGVRHNLSEYVGKGNYVLLHFWSTEAWWSRRELKHVKEIARENKDKPLTVIGISMNRNAADWKEYVKARGLNWLHLSDLSEWDGKAAKAYGVNVLPVSVLIAPDGTIIEQGLRNEKLRERIRQVVE